MRTALVVILALLLSGLGCAKKRGIMDAVFILGERSDLSPSGRDRLRLRDIDQYREALQRFFKAHKRYPNTDKQYFDDPVNHRLRWQVPDYFDGNPAFLNFYHGVLQGIYVTPPDGPCSYDQNRYIYTQTESGQSYTLTFCLGTRLRGYAAGVHTLSPKGIQ